MKWTYVLCFVKYYPKKVFVFDFSHNNVHFVDYSIGFLESELIIVFIVRVIVLTAS